MITKRKVFFAWQADKEKQWLEDLAKQGYVLEDIKLFTYTFSKQEPQDLVYQFDFQILSKANEAEYLELFEDWTFIKRFGGWYYFRKPKDSTNTNEIYNDNISKSAMFKRIIGFLALVGFPLYYQVIFVFPNMESNRLAYPNFYFFLRIIVVIFLVLHLLASLRIFAVYLSYKKKISE